MTKVEYGRTHVETHETETPGVLRLVVWRLDESGARRIVDIHEGDARYIGEVHLKMLGDPELRIRRVKK